MGTVQLFEAIVANGVRDTHFFNGRLLTAGDLRAMQEASVERDRRLGRAVGEGVASGLEATLADAGAPGSGRQPRLHVTAGLALSRRGDVLELPDDVDVALVRDEALVRAADGEFTVCAPPKGATLTNTGLYVLTIAPTSTYDGMAPMTEVGTEGVGTSCGRRWEIGGVRFGLTRLLSDADVTTATAGGTGLGASVVQLAGELETTLVRQVNRIAVDEAALERSLSRFRNAAAHLCLGTEDRRRVLVDPSGGGGALAEYGAVDRLRADGALAECEVPLALLYWSARGLEFVDQWAVRRPVVQGSASAAWGAIASERARAEGLATWLQFQGQVDDLLAPRTAPVVPVGAVRLADYFALLPSVGLLPLAAGMGAAGFDEATVFDTFPRRRVPLFIDGARLLAVLHAAFEYPPVDPAAREFLWTYVVRQNIAAPPGASAPAPCMLFATGHLPYAAEPRFDLARWTYANYAVDAGSAIGR